MEFSDATSAWIRGAFDAPTEAQTRGWESISKGDNTLILAPTGSGKTLAAFLWVIDRLFTKPRHDRVTTVLYVSPLKALSYDVERNLMAPLVGIRREAARLGLDLPEITVATRTGDTPAEDRRAMVRNPPDILITTPESLYLLLSSKARSILAGVEHVIVDEIHAMAGTKRGVHLALSLERLEQLTAAPPPREARGKGQEPPPPIPAHSFQRIGLSATQRPLELLARFLGGQDPQAGRARPVSIIDAGVRKRLEMEIVVPVEDMSGLGSGRRESPYESPPPLPSLPEGAEQLPEGFVTSGQETLTPSIWPSIYPRLLELIRANRSTLIFVNSRRLAERMAARLNELAADAAIAAIAAAEGDAEAGAQRGAAGDTAGAVGEDRLFYQGRSALPPGLEGVSGDGPHGISKGAVPELVRAHHGSIAREQRLEIEDALKAGRLPALVATSSLELGIDMGAVDLVIQIGAPTSVASGMQRIGRAGHQVGEPSRGRIFPRFRHDLLISAVIAQRMHDGQIEETTVPSNALDVLGQQIVAAVASAEGPVPVDQIREMAAGAFPYAGLPDGQLDGVLDMLAGRYPSDEFAELKPRLTWDRVAGILTARPGARMLAVTSGGTIPDRGLYGVFTPDGARVGELDEEMVYECRVAETFLLGATTWRIEEITRDRVVVTPAPGLPGKMPFWHGDSPGRPYELGQAVGEFVRTLDDKSDEELALRCDLDTLSVRNLRTYVAEEREATGGLLPTDRQVVVQRFRDELGDWRVAVLTPFGARVHAPWALAVEARAAKERDVEVQAVWSDDGIIFRFGDAEEAPDVADVLLSADTMDDLVIEAAAASAVFNACFRENAGRSLLLPKRRPGSRTPLWQLRQRANDLLAVASGHPQFPVLLETYRECLSDRFDLPSLRQVMTAIDARRIRVAGVDLPAASPFAAGLVSAYVAAFMYESDAPLAERRAQALTLDRAMLTELLGTDELRDLLDADVVDELGLELQGLAGRRPVASVDQACDLLRRLGDLSLEEIRARAEPGFDPESLIAAKRAIRVRVAGEDRLIVVEDAGRYRDALGVVLPTGIPEAFLEPVPDALSQLIRRWARTHGPFPASEPAARLGVFESEVLGILAALEEAGTVERGAFRPGGHGEEWCEAEVLRRLKQRSLAALRKEVEPVDHAALATFTPAWHGVAQVGAQPLAGGLDRLYEVIGQLQGYPIPASVLEPDVLSSRVKEYTPRLLDELLAAGEVLWVGAGTLGRDDGKVVLVQRDAAAALLPRLGFTPAAAEVADEELHRHIRDVLASRGACFFRDLALPGHGDLELIEALWDLVWAGQVTGDAFGAVRATIARGGGRRKGGGGLSRARSRPRLGSLTALGPPRAQGRWSLVERELGLESEREGRRERLARSTEASVAAASLMLERYGVLTREAVRAEGVPGGFSAIYPVLKSMEESGRIRRGYFVSGLGAAQFALPGAVERLRSWRREDLGAADQHVVHVLAATDPANVFGQSVPWPAKGPSRVAGAYVISVDGLAALYVERGGRTLVTLCDPGDDGWKAALASGVATVYATARRSPLQSYPEWLEADLFALGFSHSPKGLVKY